MLGFGPTSELVRFLVDIGRSWHVCCFVCQNLYLFVLITLIQKFYETTDHVMLCHVYTTRKLTVEDPKRSQCSSYRSQSQIVVDENRDFSLPHLQSTPPLGGSPSEYCLAVWYRKNRIVWLPKGEKNEDTVSRFDRNHERDGQTDTRTPHDDRRRCIDSIARQKATRIELQCRPLPQSFEAFRIIMRPSPSRPHYALHPVHLSVRPSVCLSRAHR